VVAVVAATEAAYPPTAAPLYPSAFKPGFHYFPIIRNSPSRTPRRGEATTYGAPAFATLARLPQRPGPAVMGSGEIREAKLDYSMPTGRRVD